MKKESKLPVFFIAHGAPNILLQQDAVLDEWKQQTRSLSPIKRILIISAHWETRCFTVGGNQQQQTIHDFYGFPEALYEYHYTPPSDVTWAGKLANTLNLEVDHQRGLDHGSWVPLLTLFPEQTLPVSQLSVAPDLGCEAHFELGKQLSYLRQQGVLIIASGVIVHNLGALNWQNHQAKPEGWALSFMQEVNEAIQAKDWQKLMNPHQLTGGKLAIPSLEHYLPLLVVLGASHEEQARAFATVWRYSNLSQHSYHFTNFTKNSSQQ